MRRNRLEPKFQAQDIKDTGELRIPNLGRTSIFKKSDGWPAYTSFRREFKLGKPRLFACSGNEQPYLSKVNHE
ncbi:MAG TPA: hypothetical protein VFM77_13200 [Terriglobales bacterium]|nr:hypothetical protein [Terriglobales bacterium]